MIYVFATSEGEGMKSEGKTPMEAYKSLCNRYRGTGRLRQLNNARRNEQAVKREGFLKLGSSYYNPVYRQASKN